MRIGIIADVHGNETALRAVFRELDAADVRNVVCAGDLVGYNAFPREVLAMARGRAVHSVCGNHDLMAVGRLALSALGPRAARGIAFARVHLGAGDRRMLALLPQISRIREGALCMHAGVLDPTRRIESDAAYQEQAALIRRLESGAWLCIVGHTHVPAATLVSDDGVVRAGAGGDVSLLAPGVWFVNPGSVGEPRSGDERASFAILDWSTRRVTFHHAAYDRDYASRISERVFSRESRALSQSAWAKWWPGAPRRAECNRVVSS